MIEEHYNPNLPRRIYSTYFDGFFSGVYAKCEDWYKDGMVHVTIRKYHKSTALSRPDEEKCFLLSVHDYTILRDYTNTLVSILAGMDERRDKNGRLVPLFIGNRRSYEAMN